jgi:hypothetical protein
VKSTRLEFSAVWVALAIALQTLTPASVSADSAAVRERAERYRKSVPDQSIQAGCAKIGVLAAPETLRKVVSDFDHYSTFIKRYKDGKLQLQVTAKLVGRVGEKRDVYLEVPILKGTAKVWGLLRFEPLKTVGSEEVFEGRMLKGNVERLDARWRIRKIDDKRTSLHLELLIVPKVPVPHDLITGELEFVSDVSVSGAREEAERQQRRTTGGS